MGLLKKIGIGFIGLIIFAMIGFIILAMIFGGDSSTNSNPALKSQGDITTQPEASPPTQDSTIPAPSSQEAVTTQPTTPKKQIVSTSFEDFETVYCNQDATQLQKKTLFDEKFKNQYVTWTGIVRSVRESSGSYELDVKHCDDTWTSDIEIKINNDQKEKLLALNEDDLVTYTAKLTSIGGLFTDLGATDGVIIK